MSILDLLDHWGPSVFMLVTVAFAAGITKADVKNLCKRVDRIEKTLDAFILEIRNGGHK